MNPSVYEGLRAVDGLRYDPRKRIRESEPVRPISQETVDLTLPHVSPQVAAMIRLQWLTGMRPGEVLAMDGKYLTDQIENCCQSLNPAQIKFLIGCVILEIRELAEYVVKNASTLPPTTPDFSLEYVVGELVEDRNLVGSLKELRLDRGIEFLFSACDASEVHHNSVHDRRNDRQRLCDPGKCVATPF